MIKLYKFNYFFFSRIFSKFLNRFTHHSNSNKIERLLEKYLINLKRKKKINFFLMFLESLSLLRPELGVRIFKFNRKKGAKRKKKGTRFRIRTKVFPIVISKEAKYRMALNFLVISIKRSKKKFSGNFFDLFTKKIWEVLRFKKRKKMALRDKKNQRRLVLVNRGSIHYRW
jgi:hypothetical protein